MNPKTICDYVWVQLSTEGEEILRSFYEPIESVKKIDESPEVYLQMMHEPIIKGDAKLEMEKRRTQLLDFLREIVNNRYEIRRNNVYVGKRYQERMARFSGVFKIYRFCERLSGYIANRLNIRADRD